MKCSETYLLTVTDVTVTATNFLTMTMTGTKLLTMTDQKAMIVTTTNFLTMTMTETVTTK